MQDLQWHKQEAARQEEVHLAIKERLGEKYDPELVDLLLEEMREITKRIAETNSTFQ